MKRNCANALVIVLAVTFVGHQFSTSIWGPYSIMESTATFEDYDSFIQYMQQDISAASGYHTDLRAAQQTAAVRHVIFCAAYCLECLVIAAVYIRKKAT